MRVAVCGVGNRIRGDDGIGPGVIDALRGEVDERDVLLLDCERSPENVLGKLQAFSPEKVILIDAVDLGKRPGRIGLVDIHTIKKQAMSTHKLPLNLFIDYLQARMKFKLLFIGVQPGELGLNRKMSRECRKAIPLVKELVKQHL
jgi:hydrogenase 3 maturation protease